MLEDRFANQGSDPEYEPTRYEGLDGILRDLALHLLLCRFAELLP